MAHDSSEGLTPAGWLPDRISVGVLTSAFPPELVDRAVEAAGVREQRRRVLPARLMVYFVLALWLFRGPDCGYAQVMAKLIDGLGHQARGGDPLARPPDAGNEAAAGGSRPRQPPNISSLARGRGRLGPAPVRILFEQAAGPTGDLGAPGVSCRGLRVVSVDGAVTDVPASKANEEWFGRAPDQPVPSPFPQVKWVVAAESGTGSLLGAAFGPGRVPERDLFAELVAQRRLGRGMLVLADQRFLSWPLARAVLATGASILWRAPADLALEPAGVLEDGTYLAELKPPGGGDGPAVIVRVIDCSVRGTRDDGATKRRPDWFRLVTNLLDVRWYPALDLARCYQHRWGRETVIGQHETDMGEGQPVLRSKDPVGIEQEMWAFFAVYQAIYKIIGMGATAADRLPAPISISRAPVAVTGTITGPAASDRLKQRAQGATA